MDKCDGIYGGKCYSPKFCNEYGCASNKDAEKSRIESEASRLKALLKSAISAADCGEIWGRDKVHEAMMLIGGQESSKDLRSPETQQSS